MSVIATQLEPHEPGRYTRSGWSVGSPGTYALIIGVSNYTYVDQLAPFGLGKLFVSALTAFHFFRWLTERYQYKETGVERVWLLLSPTPDEIDQEPDLANFGQPATFNNCKLAIKEWYSELGNVKEDPDSVSRSVVFFSGHGFQVYSGKQLLLPQDYLQPPEGSFNDAISTANLAEGVRYTSVLRHFFFIDACRNDTSKLRAKEQTLVGASIINVPTGKKAGRGYAKLLYGTSPGDETWQPKTVNEGLTFYGDALLRGLSVDHPDVPLPDKTTRPWAIPFEGLFQYVASDVLRTLNRNGLAAIDPIEEDGPRRDLTPPVVAHVSEEPPLITEDVDRKPPISRMVVDAAVSAANCLTTSGELTAAVARRLVPDMWYVKRLVSGASYDSLLDEKPDFDSRHEEFGSENVTAFYADATVYDVAGERDAPGGLRINRVERLPSRKFHVVTFRLPEVSGRQGRVCKAWLALPGDGAAYGTMLPGGPLHFRATTIRSRLGRLALNTLRVDLADDNPWLVVKSTIAWRAARNSDPEPICQALFEAFAPYEYSWGGKLSAELGTDPQDGGQIAATLATLLLLETEEGHELDLEDLALRAEWSDIAVLWLQRLMDDSNKRESAKAVDRIVELGVPMLSPVVDVLRAQMDRLDQGGALSAWREVRVRLREKFAESLAFHRSGGLFPVFAVTTPDLMDEWKRAVERLREPTSARVLA